MHPLKSVSPSRTGVAAAIVGVTVIVACVGGSKLETVPDPARGVRVVAADDTELLPISLAAGANVKAEARGGPVGFLGVIIDNRLQLAVTDSLIRNFGFIKAVSKRQPFVIVNPPGSKVAPVSSFAMVRATADSAYVGGTQTSTRSGPNTAPAAFCIVLAKAQGAWSAVRRANVDHAEDCGR